MRIWRRKSEREKERKGEREKERECVCEDIADPSLSKNKTAVEHAETMHASPHVMDE